MNFIDIFVKMFTEYPTLIGGVGLLGKSFWDVSQKDYISAYHDFMLALGAFGVHTTLSLHRNVLMQMKNKN